MIEHIAGFHIEPTNICTLKCSGCARTQFLEQWPQHWKNHNLDIDALLQFLDVDLKDKRIDLCGNYGDPIYHPDLIDFVKKLKTRGAIITIATNGSYKNHVWWEELVANLNVNDTVMFSVDGVPDNFTEYRVNANWDSIKIGMDVVAKAQCNSTWKFIPFSFNQNDIDQATELSRSIGIKNFVIEYSDRFDEKTQALLPHTSSLGPRYSAQNLWKASADPELKVEPKCQNGREHFISADGHYSPCCFIADHRFYYKSQFGKNKKQYNIFTTTLSEVLSAETVVDFYQNVDQQPGCQFNCPKISG
jgi:pyruvate-formate lyase-activating enzyme